jgi:hypothetical protein
MHDSELKKYVSDTIVTLNAFEAGWVGHEKPEISSNSDPKSSEESARDAAHFNAELEIRNEEQRRYDRDYAVQFQKQFPFLPELQQELARRCNNRHVSTNDVTSPDYSIDRRKNSADKWAGYLYEMTRCLND